MPMADIRFDIDDFNKPLVLTGKDAIVHSILTLLSMENVNPNTPNMYVDLNKYRYDIITPDLLSNIASDIQEKCREFLPWLNVSNVDVEHPNEDKNAIVIVISVIVEGSNFEIVFASQQDNTGNKLTSYLDTEWFK